MSPEQQRIAIAEACGWKRNSLAGIPGWSNEIRWWPVLPGYLNDLNAMHEAEKTLNEEQHARYTTALFQITGGAFSKVGNGKPTSRERFNMVHATAAQRAEAFLRTIGEWKD